MMRTSAIFLVCLFGGALANNALRGKAQDPNWLGHGGNGDRMEAHGEIDLPIPDEDDKDVVLHERVDKRLAEAHALTKRLNAQADAETVARGKNNKREDRLDAQEAAEEAAQLQDAKTILREEGPAGGIQYDDKKFKKAWRQEWRNGDYPSYKKTYSENTFPGRKAIVAASDSQSDGKPSPALQGPNVGAYLKLHQDEYLKPASVQLMEQHQTSHLMEHHLRYGHLLRPTGVAGDFNPEDVPRTYAERHMLDNGNQGRNPLHYHGTPLMGWGLPAPDYDSK